MSQISIKLDHLRLDVSDIKESELFYSRALALQRVVCYELRDRVILQMGPQGEPPGVELWQEKGVTPAPHPTQHLAFAVSDVRELTERIRSLGYRVLRDPYCIGEETVAFIADPDGHTIELNDFRGRGTTEG